MPDKPQRQDTRRDARERDIAAGLATRVLRVRIKDKHASWLRARAADVNLVWNFCNETSFRILQRERRFASAYELDALTTGATKAGLALHSQTVQAIASEFVTRRRQFRKARLRWRVSNRKRANYSLGWVPFKKSAMAYRNGQVFLAGYPLSLWDSYGLASYELGAGSVSEDARGRWYLNVAVKVKKAPKPPVEPLQACALGIDLGLKDLVAASDGLKVQAQRFYRGLEPKLAVAQRAGKGARVRALHAKIANRRRDHLHKLSTSLVREHAAIFVGNVSASGLAQTSMAKSVCDAGWSSFRTILQYKCDDAGVWFKEVNEAHSTQDCHVCHARTGPKGREELDVRVWRCASCGTEHDRDTNAACNIRATGLAWLEKVFAEAGEAKANEAASNKAAKALPRPDMAVSQEESPPLPA